MYRIKYHRLIRDGDRNAYKLINLSRTISYAEVIAEKVECRNYLLRNYSIKLKEIVTDRHYDVKGRKWLQYRLLCLRISVKYAMKHNKTESDQNRL